MTKYRVTRSVEVEADPGDFSGALAQAFALWHEGGLDGSGDDRLQGQDRIDYHNKMAQHRSGSEIKVIADTPEQEIKDAIQAHVRQEDTASGQKR
jgi:hypothetical protein